MARSQSVINLDPIDRAKKLGFFGRLLITRYDGGEPVSKSEPFGHYMFCGPQRSGKTASVLWYLGKLSKRYKKRRIKYFDETKGKHGRFVKFSEPPVLKVYSNFGIGQHVNKSSIFDLIDEFDPYANEVRFVLIDEFHTYFPKGSNRKEDKEVLAHLTAVFSQLAKRNVFVLSTAQVYGRLDKSLREQCLYMVSNRVNIHNRIESEFILESEILCDELGRWAGRPKFIWSHGISHIQYDTKKLIRE